MAQFESGKDEIKRTGASVLFIAAEKRSGLFKPEKFLAEHPVSFPFLLDEDRRVTKEYGVYHRLGKDAFNIARPATLVVDRGGVIRFIHVGADQHDRVGLERVLAAVKKL
jgi:peroxiredoxin